MPKPDRAIHRFVRALLAGAEPRRTDTGAETAGVYLEAKTLLVLTSAGVLDSNLRTRPEARSWLKRQMLDADAFAAQHRHEVQTGDLWINVRESPLGRLATGRVPFLAPHQVLAGERVRTLCDRAALQPRMTMSYGASEGMRSKARTKAPDLSDMVVDARRQLNELLAALPHDCAGVVLDVCGFLKGLQQVEAERRWPRRSAKLVLRIGLEQTAQHFGLSALAEGPPATSRQWGRRPTVVG